MLSRSASANAKAAAKEMGSSTFMTPTRWIKASSASRRRRSGRAMGVMATYPLFFAATNAVFVRGGLADAAARSLLDRWATWHWIRTGLGVVGFAAALRALQVGAGTRLPPASYETEGGDIG